MRGTGRRFSGGKRVALAPAPWAGSVPSPWAAQVRLRLRRGRRLGFREAAAHRKLWRVPGGSLPQRPSVRLANGPVASWRLASRHTELGSPAALSPEPSTPSPGPWHPSLWSPGFVPDIHQGPSALARPPGRLRLEEACPGSCVGHAHLAPCASPSPCHQCTVRPRAGLGPERAVGTSCPLGLWEGGFCMGWALSATRPPVPQTQVSWWLPG